MTSTRRAAYLLLSLAAAGAGIIHLVVAGQHAQPLGTAFAVAGVLQLSWAVAMVVRPSRALLLAGAAGSVVFLGAYVASRTVGLLSDPESVGTADLLCCALEAPVAIGAFLLARRPDALRRPVTKRIATVLAASALMIGAATTVAVAAPAHEDGHGHEQTCPSSPQLTGKLDARGVDTGVTAYFACKLAHSHDVPHAE